MTLDSDTHPDLLEQLVEEFTARCRRGESPTVVEYAARYPQHAAQIETLLPAVAALEQLRADERAAREAVLHKGALAQPPEHLGDFQILREIGRGGMGIVYEAKQRSLSRRVAVKVLPRHALLREKHLERFLREAQTAARLHHTGIVPVFGVGDQEGLHYYVMPLIRGVGLDEVVRELRARSATAAKSSRDVSEIVSSLADSKFGARDPQLQDGVEATRTVSVGGDRGGSLAYWHAVAQVGAQAAEALDYAHRQGTLHRDIKPSNLLLNEDGVLSIADFGLARAIESCHAGHSNDFVGTAQYMAPEQLRGFADARSDIYGLGLTLYELLTLRPAFDARDRAFLLRGGQFPAEPPQPRKINPSIPRDLETIVLKCSASEPAKRYQTASDLAADLRRFLADRPVRARRVSALERAARWCRRNPALAAISVLAIGLFLTLGVTALLGDLHTRSAYAETRKALKQAETTSRLAIDVLNGIYTRLSPRRIWIASDADPAGQSCACVGLRAGDESASSVERTALQVRASQETATLLESLLVFYDRLAAEGGDSQRLVLQSAIAHRRVGDIHVCLGRIDQAEQAYLRAVQRLTASRPQPVDDLECATELAHDHNEIGSIRSARGETQRAYESHQAALDVLGACEASSPLAEYRYELARTYYFLAVRGMAISTDSGRHNANGQSALFPDIRPASSGFRRSAIRILEELTLANPRAPDYRLLLALCHRDTAAPVGAAGGSRKPQGRQRAIRILEALTAEYPDVADYRYELVATYAWIPVNLFPWQGRTTVSSEGEQSLRRAIREAEWLVAHNSSIPHYVRSRTLVFAKLASACWGSRRLAEAEELFQKAVQSQDALLADFPNVPAHDRVLLQFLRLKVAQVRLDRSTHVNDSSRLAAARTSLEECIEWFTQFRAEQEWAGDRLAQTCLPLAYDTLGDVLYVLGQKHEAEEAKNKGKAARLSESDPLSTPQNPPTHTRQEAQSPPQTSQSAKGSGFEPSPPGSNVSTNKVRMPWSNYLRL